MSRSSTTEPEQAGGKGKRLRGKKRLKQDPGKLSESDEKRIHDMKYFKQGLSHPLAFSALLPVFLSHPLPDPSKCINPFQGWVITEGEKRSFQRKQTPVIIEPHLLICLFIIRRFQLVACFASPFIPRPLLSDYF